MGELIGAAMLSVKRAGLMASLVLMLVLLTGGYYVQVSMSVTRGLIKIRRKLIWLKLKVIIYLRIKEKLNLIYVFNKLSIVSTSETLANSQLLSRSFLAMITTEFACLAAYSQVHDVAEAHIIHSLWL